MLQKNIVGGGLDDSFFTSFSVATEAKVVVEKAKANNRTKDIFFIKTRSCVCLLHPYFCFGLKRLEPKRNQDDAEM